MSKSIPDILPADCEHLPLLSPVLQLFEEVFCYDETEFSTLILEVLMRLVNVLLLNPAPLVEKVGAEM